MPTFFSDEIRYETYKIKKLQTYSTSKEKYPRDQCFGWITRLEGSSVTSIFTLNLKAMKNYRVAKTILSRARITQERM